MRNINLLQRGLKSKRKVFFIHGISSSVKVFKPYFDNSSITHELIAIDLPGHGESFHSKDYYINSYRNIVSDLIEPDDDVILVGNSLGGHLAMEIAENNYAIKGLVIMGAPPVEYPINIEEAFLPNDIIQYYFKADVGYSELDNALLKAVHNTNIIKTLRDDFLLCDPSVRTIIGKELLENQSLNDEAKIFKGLKIPRLIIHGDNDPTTNLEYLHKVKRESYGDVAIEVVENCGHYPSLEQPGRFESLINNFANQVFQ